MCVRARARAGAREYLCVDHSIQLQQAWPCHGNSTKQRQQCHWKGTVSLKAYKTVADPGFRIWEGGRGGGGGGGGGTMEGVAVGGAK